MHRITTGRAAVLDKLMPTLSLTRHLEATLFLSQVDDYMLYGKHSNYCKALLGVFYANRSEGGLKYILECWAQRLVI